MTNKTRMYNLAESGTARALGRTLLFGVGIGLVACGDELPLSPEDMAVEPVKASLVGVGVPGRVSNLKATAASETSVTLTWTEVDDGTGQPAQYQVRHAPTPIGYGWGSATPVKAGSCADPIAGNGIGLTRTCTVTGLSANANYDFQLVAFRLNETWRAYGSLSNVATARTVVRVTNPQSVADLGVAATTETSATLSFTQVPDGAGSAATYEIRYAATPMGWGWGSATIPQTGACARPIKGTTAGEKLTCAVDGLSAETSYDFQIVAYRETSMGRVYSPLSKPVTGKTKAKGGTSAAAPTKVGDLSVASTTTSGATLRWTQVSDGAGGAASYEIRYTPTPIGWNWGSATPVTSGACAVPIRGTTAGQSLSCAVGGLSSGKSYDFQIVAFRETDSGRVYSDLSNVATGKTLTDGNGDTGGTDPATGGGSTGGRYGAQPTGFTKITDRPFNEANEDGWRSSGGLTNDSDASAPLSGPGTLRATFPKGFGGGYSPIWSDRSISSLGYGRVYVSFALKLSDNWQGHSTGTNKIGFVWLNDKPVVFFNAYGKGSGTLTPIVSVQNTPNGSLNLMPNVGNAVVKRGQWQQWEAVLVVNSGSNADGQIHLWIDGVKVAEYKNMNLSSGGKVWEYLTWRPIWGGRDDVVQNTQYMWMDHYYASGTR